MLRLLNKEANIDYFTKHKTKEDQLFECLTLVAVAKDCLTKLDWNNHNLVKNTVKLILVDLENAYQGLHKLYSQTLRSGVQSELGVTQEDKEDEWLIM